MSVGKKLRLLSEAGVDTIYQDKPVNRLKPIKANDEKIAVNNFERQIVDACANLEELKQQILQYDNCILKKGAISTVFADGDPNSAIMFIGEAPGASEDEQGIPFCGQSGKLLNNVIAALGFSRQEIYISNTVFWRPPGNRRPTTQELQQCRPFVEKHIALANPKILVLVGSTAVESLLDVKTPMQQLRGNFFTYNNQYLTAPIKTYVIFHPSFLLRQPGRKKDMWFDVLKLRQELDR